MALEKTKTAAQNVPASKVAGIQTDDWRLIENGTLILAAKGYADQPYFLRADDGALVLVCTTGPLEEGEFGQHIICSRSEDDGITWSEPVALEPADGPEASWAILHKTPRGRLYAFYTYNADNVRKVPGDTDTYPDGWCCRVDTLGYFVFKYSDDHGRSWSSQRFTIPVREFKLDRENPTKGAIWYFWNVGKPFCRRGSVYLPVIKVGRFGKGMFAHSEGVIVCSHNLQTETDPQKIRFETLPDGDVGICAPKGEEPVSEEHSFAVLSDGTLFCVFRTISGYSACCYSRDGGHTWTDTDYMRYPNGRRIKNPRAANFIWQLSNNRYLYWFHNHSGAAYHDRNPAWCLAAFEVDSPYGKMLEFSQPEILLYTIGEINRRMSYPDLLELDDGSLLVSETEKLFARIHRVPAGFVNKVCGQRASLPLTDPSDILLDWNAEKDKAHSLELPKLPAFFSRWAKKSNERNDGITIGVEIACDAATGVLLDNRDACGKGFTLSLTEDFKARIDLCDGRVGTFWQSTDTLPLQSAPVRVTVVIDGKSQIISIIINEQFDDGGKTRQFGWGRLNPLLLDVNASQLRIGGCVNKCRIYNRALLTAEAVAEQTINSTTTG